MSEFNAIRNRIIIQFRQVNSFQSSNATEVACVRDLAIEGAVQASFITNSNGVETATITTITKYGYSLIDSYIQNGSNTRPTVEVAEREQIASDKAFDDTLLKVSMAALGVQFGLLPVLQKCQICDAHARVLFWLVTAFWGACVVSMVVSHMTSKYAFAAVGKSNTRRCRLCNGITKTLNCVSLCTYSLAIGAFVLFVVRISPKIIGG